MTVDYPNAFNCREMIPHKWLYYKRGLRPGDPGAYRCQVCQYVISKPELKEQSDSA